VIEELDAQLAFLNAINSQVNALPYEAVQSDDAGDVWIDQPQPGHSFECRDYTLMKARLMREQGWDELLMGIVLLNIEPPTRELHAVQFAKTDGGIYILDNRVIDPSRVYLWTEPVFDYQWLHQQQPGQLDNAGNLVWRDATTGLV
jgi:predicted transglutaminase-like cysteine proteinase